MHGFVEAIILDPLLIQNSLKIEFTVDQNGIVPYILYGHFIVVVLLFLCMYVKVSHENPYSQYLLCNKNVHLQPQN